MVRNTDQVTLPGRTIRDRIDALERLASGNTSAFLSKLRSALDDRSPAVRERAVLLVTEHGLTEASLLVERLLKDRNELVRHNAAECVGILGDNESPHPGLRALLSDRSALVRAQAAESLGLVGDEGALPKLTRLLGDRTPYVRSYAASAIGYLQGFAHRKRIRQTLENEKSEVARVGMLEALFLMGERSTLPEFLGLLESSDYHVRCGVANALEVMPLDASETKVAVTALLKASRKPLGVADGSTMKRVLRTLRGKHKTN